MSKPSSRGTPWALPPRPSTMWRSWRSFMSTTRFQVILRTSMPSSLPFWMCASSKRREKVVGRADGVEVAGEMQVDVFHGNNLGVAATGRTALDTEHRAERRLAQRHDHVLAAQRKRIGQAHRRGGLALSGRRGIDCGHQDELARGVLILAQQVVIDLRLVVSVQLKVLFVDAGNGSDLANRFRFGRLGNFNVGQHVGPFFLMSRRAGVPGSLIDRWRSAGGRNRPADQTLTLPF